MEKSNQYLLKQNIMNLASSLIIMNTLQYADLRQLFDFDQSIVKS